MNFAKSGVFLEAYSNPFSRCHRCQRPFEEGQAVVFLVVLAEDRYKVAATARKQQKALGFEHRPPTARDVQARVCMQLVHENCNGKEPA